METTSLERKRFQGFCIFVHIKLGEITGSNTNKAVKRSDIYYIAINLTTFEFKLCPTKESLASNIKVHRNSLIDLKDRSTHKGWLVIIKTLD